MPNLHVLEDFADEIRVLEWSMSGNQPPPVSESNLYCERCRGPRRMQVQYLYRPVSEPLIFGDPGAGLTPSCFKLRCVQCKAVSIAVIFEGPSGPTLAILRSTRGGMSSEHTPTAISYYLDQAARAQSVGALSAAIVMYRSALEHLLFEQGYKNGMCGKQLEALFKDKENGKAPAWASQLHDDDLTVLNKLGNGAVHANGGDVSKQQAIDAELYAAVTVTFEALLEAVYERPRREAERRAKLTAAAAKLR